MPMKKLLMAAALIMFATHSNAEQIQIINPHSTTGTTAKVLNNIHESNPELFAAPVKVDNCSVGSNILMNTDKPTITIGDYLAQGISSDQSCNIVSADNLVTIYSIAYYSICSKKDSGKDLDYLINNPGAKVGHFADFMFTKQVQEAMKAIKSKGTNVPYKGSKEYLAALEIGEIDYIFTSRPDDTLDCILTTDPNSENAIAKYEDNVYTTGYYGLAIFGANVNLDDVKAIIDQSTELEVWKEKMPAYKNTLTFLSRDEQMGIIRKEIEAYKQ